MVTEVLKPENSYQSAFQALRQSKPTVAWVELVRESAMDRFESLGFPTVKDEDWKYTNLAPLSKESFSPVPQNSELTSKHIDRFLFPETIDSHVVVVN